ncbi:DUF6064 family protein [Rivibacter subsaxonicus]|uniref:MFS transporter permease n=1 Tax=Rivibacter subsaxonicus TaxID=457575 RepID=A0A4Q7VB18_9BURK|nr:DUF6064 family protein [Rivibacter subsaxonicus]RZT91888.1 hypothetical protein EV670_3560 [Rivibacter subsaxonicus]
MSEGSRYELADLLLFSARTYYRQFELYNAELWPAQLFGIGLGLGILALVRSGTSRSARAVPLLLAACWLWVAWAFHLQRYADINWAATWFAAAFATQGLMLLLAGAGAAARPSVGPVRAASSAIGLGLMVFALFVQPWIGVLFGRAWRQAEFFGLAPDPTVVFTLGVLLLLQPVRQGQTRTRPLPALLWPIPLLWCAVSGATLWTMRAPDAVVMPLAALVAVVGLGIRAWSRA